MTRKKFHMQKYLIFLQLHHVGQFM
jgi:hypothetical protein